MTGLPPGVKLQIEFGALYSGMWTDVTADASMSAASFKFGRNSEYSAAAPASFTVTLDNSRACSKGEGAYTPGRQVLADGTTANSLYPNVVPEKRIQLLYVVSATTYYLYTGFIKAWKPTMGNDGMTPSVVVEAIDISDRLSRCVLQAPLMQEVLFDDPGLFWPLTDPTGSAYAVQLGSFSSPTTALYEVPPGAYPLVPAVTGTGGGDAAFGGNGVGSGNGTAFALTPPSVSNGSYLFAPLQTTIGTFGMFGGEIFVQLSVPAATETALLVNTTLVSLEIQVDTSGHVVMVQNGSTVATSTNSIADGLWHALAFTVVTLTGPPRTQLTLWVDAVSIGSANVSGTSTGASGVYVGKPGGLFSGNVGYLSLYPTAPSSTRLAAHYAAATGYAGDTTGARIARVLTWAGLDSSQWNLDTGSAVVNSYPQAGKTALQYCQDMAVTEGGGAAFYVTPDGKARFADRSFRSTTVAATFDAGADLDVTFTPALDSRTLVNQAVVSRATASDTASTQTYTDTDSVAAFGLFSTSLTSYAMSDLDALALGQYAVAAQANPAYRVPQLTVDMLTATSASLTAVGLMQIGSRIRATSLDAAAAPVSQMDFYAEGWTVNLGADVFTITYDLSSADNPVRGLYDDTTQGRYGPGTSMTLTSTYAAGTTTIQVTTTAGYPTFTTVSARYPLSIKVNEEEIVLNSAPSGSSSPQTFTGVTRGANHTIAASQAAGSQVHLAHQATYTL